MRGAGTRAIRSHWPRQLCTCRRLAVSPPSTRPTHINQKSIITEPMVYLVWCNDPPVGVGYRSASGYTPTCPAREAADLVLKNYSVIASAGIIPDTQRPGPVTGPAPILAHGRPSSRFHRTHYGGRTRNRSTKKPALSPALAGLRSRSEIKCHRGGDKRFQSMRRQRVCHVGFNDQENHRVNHEAEHRQ